MIDGKLSGTSAWVPFSSRVSVVAGITQHGRKRHYTVIEISLVARTAAQFGQTKQAGTIDARTRQVMIDTGQ